ncbi:MAG: helix-turn-helix protein [Polaromonas sp.]|nr:helix-turn-helix protein [Polaromonas sp.]
MIDRAWPAVDHSGLTFGTSMNSEREATTADVASPGFLLRRAREKAGLHIGALAVSLKVPVKKLEALEADRLDLLPDVVFARALALSVCRALKVDATLVLERLPQADRPQFSNPAMSINAPFRAAGKTSGSLWGRASRRSVVVGLLLILGAAALIFLPSLTNTAAFVSNSGAYRALAEAVSSLSGGLSQDSGQRGADVSSTGAGNDAPSLTSSSGDILSNPEIRGSTLPDVGNAVTTSVATVNIAGTDATSATGQTTAAASGDEQKLLAETLVFIAKSESWVEVTDAKGQVVLRRTLAAGEAVGVSGELPLSAVVGRADATRVQVRGQTFDLNSHIRNNVARFEVK